MLSHVDIRLLNLLDSKQYVQRRFLQHAEPAPETGACLRLSGWKKWKQHPLCGFCFHHLRAQTPEHAVHP